MHYTTSGNSGTFHFDKKKTNLTNKQTKNLTFLIGEDATLYRYFFSSLKAPAFPVVFPASVVNNSIKSLNVTLAPRVKV